MNASNIRKKFFTVLVVMSVINPIIMQIHEKSDLGILMKFTGLFPNMTAFTIVRGEEFYLYEHEYEFTYTSGEVKTVNLATEHVSNAGDHHMIKNFLIVMTVMPLFKLFEGEEQEKFHFAKKAFCFESSVKRGFGIKEGLQKVVLRSINRKDNSQRYVRSIICN